MKQDILLMDENVLTKNGKTRDISLLKTKYNNPLVFIIYMLCHIN